MRGSRKYLTILFSILGALLLTQAPNALASATSSRLMGNDRYLTAIEVSKEGWTEGADTVILTNGEDFPDALSAAPLAQKYNAPILLTEAQRLQTDTASELKRLKVKKAVLVGGEGVISADVAKQLKLMGISTTRLAGQNRYDTALAVAQEVGIGQGVFVLGGETFQDALIAAPIAAAQGMPILLVPTDELTANQKSVLSKTKVLTGIFIGKETEFSDQVLQKFPTREWITGSDAYERNISLLTRFADSLDFNTVYVATGRDFPDALAASALAQKGKNPLFILNGSTIPNPIRSFISNRVISYFKVLGGEKIISQDTKNALAALPAQFSSYKNISVRIQEKQKYELPKTVTMKVSTGEWEEVPVTWGLSYVSTLRAGTYQYEGTVKGYGNYVYLTLIVDPIPSKVAALTAEIVQGDSYYLTDLILVTMTDNSVRQYPVTWSSNIVTMNKVGSYSFQGVIEGTTLKAALSLKVSEDSAITFKDFGLEEAVRAEANRNNYSQPVYKRDVLRITSLDADGYGISDLAGLESFTNLEDLDLQNNDLTGANLAPLQKLTNLKYLNLEDNQLEQITSLKGLSNLTFLDVSGNVITDFSPLKGLTRLSTLYLSGNATQDYSPLRPIYYNLSREDFELE